MNDDDDDGDDERNFHIENIEIYYNNNADDTVFKLSQNSDSSLWKCDFHLSSSWFVEQKRDSERQT